jgi:DNA invertase Pin-like site-specific DNA recombinase
MNAERQSLRVAYSYIRFSSPKQEYGDSIRRQKEGSAALAKKKGWILDESLKIDRGLSAFTGENRHSGALKLFLDKIKSGQVKPGSVLIVESLDRLSREDMDEAFDLFRSILKAGIEIATVNPERHYDKSSLKSLVGVIEPLVHMQLANEESAKKAARGKEAWENKRKSGSIISARVPLWLRAEMEKVDGRVKVKSLHIIPERAKVVQLVFDLALSGLGNLAIARKLNAAGIAPLSSSKVWNQAAIGNLLNNRATIGEFQPESGRKPVGQPIADYYPAVISLDKWYAVHALLSPRKMKASGRKGQNINLFRGLLKDAADGSNLVLVNKHSKGIRNNYLVNGNALHGQGQYISVDYYVFQEAFLAFMGELKAKELWAEDRTDTLFVKIASVKGQIAEKTNAIDHIKIRQLESYSEDRADLMDKLEEQRKDLRKQLEQLEAEKASNPAEDLEDLTSIPLNTPEDRERVQSKMRSLVQEIWVLLWQCGRYKKRALVQCYFREGNLTRWYLVDYDAKNKKVSRDCCPVDLPVSVDHLDLRQCRFESC